ncbi:MAG TPA: hypothetical protein VLD60_06990 [Nitrospira sp.]|nr:hypothetical protein [Nitrospira sp.]
MNALHVGQKVPIEIVRDGGRLQGSIMIGELPVGALKSKSGPGQQVAGAMFPGTMAGPHYAAVSF